MLYNMNIIFPFIVFHYSSGLKLKFELYEEIQSNEINLIDISTT
jgi:hypothetical protein